MINSTMAMSYIRLPRVPARIHDVIFRGFHGLMFIVKWEKF